MAAKQVKDGWKVDFRVGGKDGKRYRKTCKTKSEAERYQKYVEAQFIANGKPWNDKPTDPRTLSELAELWRQHYGVKLVDYHARVKKLNSLVNALGNPIASKITAESFNRYMSSRIESGKQHATINKERMMLNAVYNGLKRLNIIDYDNPIKEVKKLKSRQSEMRFLSHEEIRRLLFVLQNSEHPEVSLIAEICLSTGARWGEAERLTNSRLQENKVTFADNKNGKNRSIPINDYLYDKLKKHATAVGENQLFQPSMKMFYRALDMANITLPKGQKTHVLRHSFASHFMINGGNILSLQRILDHSSISMTMKYAHLSPNHMLDALQYNPLHRK